MIERTFRIELNLGSSLVRDCADTPHQRLRLGVGLLLDAGSLVEAGKHLHALEPLFEGLGWVYLSHAPKSDAYRMAVGLAAGYLERLERKTLSLKTTGWRMSAEQIDCYGEIAGLILDADSAAAAQRLLRRVDIIPQWSTLPKNIF